MATALYDFHGSSANELSFDKGAAIIVTAQLDGGWWRGRLADTPKSPEAHFPEVYVRLDMVPLAKPSSFKTKDKRTAALATSAATAVKTAAAAAAASAAAGGLKARALFDFSGATVAELTFKVGDMITDVVCLEGEWWRGRFASRLGHFPHTYVELVVSRGDAAAAAAAAAANAGAEPSLPPPAKLESARGSKVRARAKFAYHGLTATELSFAAGDIIADVVCLEGEWWRGRHRGQLGHYPATWVELLANDESSVPSSDPPALTKREKSVKQLAVVPSASSSSTSFTALSPRLSELVASMNAAQKAAPVEHRRHKAFRARAVKSFHAADATQLSFDEGNEIVVVAERDDGWWRGVLHAKEGLFPADCVQTVTPLEPIGGASTAESAPPTSSSDTITNSSSGNTRPKKKKKRASGEVQRKRKSLRSKHTEGKEGSSGKESGTSHKKRSSKDAAGLLSTTAAASNGAVVTPATNTAVSAAAAPPTSSKDAASINTDDDDESESVVDALPPTPTPSATPAVATVAVVAAPAAKTPSTASVPADDLATKVAQLEEQNRLLREEVRSLRQSRRASIDNSTLSPRGNSNGGANTNGAGGTSGSATLRATSSVSKSSSLAAAATVAAAAKDEFDSSRTTSLFSNEMALDSKLQVRIVDIERRLGEQHVKNAAHHSGLALEYSRIEMAYHTLRRRVDEATQALDTVDTSSLAERVRKNPFLSRDKKSLRSTTTKK
jgi:phage gp37-like protein